MSYRFPHPLGIGVFGDTNNDGRVDAYDLSNVLSALRTGSGYAQPPVAIPLPQPPPFRIHGQYPRRMLLVQCSGPQIGSAGPGWNSPMVNMPWLDIPTHGFRRVVGPHIDRNVDPCCETYDGVAFWGLCGVQDEYTAYRNDRNHGYASIGLLRKAVGVAFSEDCREWLEELIERDIYVMIYNGGAPNPIETDVMYSGDNGPRIRVDVISDEAFGDNSRTLDALSEPLSLVSYDHKSRLLMGYDAISARPMREFPSLVLKLAERTVNLVGSRMVCEGPLEHDDPRVLAQIGLWCDEMGTINSNGGNWMDSPHAKIMLNPQRRAWFAVHAPLVHQFWMLNGTFSPAEQTEIKRVAAALNITLIDLLDQR